MIFSVVYLLVRCLLGSLTVLARHEASKDAADQPAAVAVALAVVSDALKTSGCIIHPLTGPP